MVSDVPRARLWVDVSGSGSMVSARFDWRRAAVIGAFATFITLASGSAAFASCSTSDNHNNYKCNGTSDSNIDDGNLNGGGPNFNPASNGSLTFNGATFSGTNAGNTFTLYTTGSANLGFASINGSTITTTVSGISALNLSTVSGTLSSNAYFGGGGTTLYATGIAGTISSNSGSGIYATTTTGIIDFSGTATVTGGATNASGTYGIYAAASGAGAVTIDWSSGTSSSTISGGTGISASVGSGGSGDVTVKTGAGTVTGTSGDGIDATNSGTGNVNVTISASTNGTLYGVNAQAAGGTVTVTNNSGATISGGTGISASVGSGGSGDVIVKTGAGTVTGTSGDGIDATNSGTGNVNVTISASTTGTVYGVNAQAAGGTVTVTNNSGATISASGGSAVAAVLLKSTGGTTNLTNASGATISGSAIGLQLAGSGGGTITNHGYLYGATTALAMGSSGSVTLNTDGIIASGSGGVPTVAAIAVSNGTLTINALSGAILIGAVKTASGAQTNFTNSGTWTNLGNSTLTSLSNAGTITMASSDTLTVAGTLVNSAILTMGGSTVTAATLSQSAGTIQNGTANVGTYQLTGGTLASNATVKASSTFDMQAGTVNGVLAGSGSLTKSTSGTVTLSGANTYTGATTVNSGVLNVVGAIANSTTTVNGGTLTGTGSISNTLVSGGTFLPGSGVAGTAMTVNGTLGFAPGSAYAVYLSPSTASRANVSGAATLGGATFNAVFASGNYISKTYTVLTAASINGTFGPLTNSNLPNGFTDALSYGSTAVYLNLSLSSETAGYSYNQHKVFNALSNYFSQNSGIPAAFGGLSASQLGQLSGEAATGMQSTSFRAMNSFTSLFFDGGGIGDTNLTGARQNTVSFYTDPTPAQKAEATVFSAFAPQPPAPNPWSLWAEGYGGSSSVSGNVAAGTSTTSEQAYGYVLGADYRVDPNLVMGFSLGGGGTNFSLANNIGGGHSELLQTGVFAKRQFGELYVEGAFAYGWQNVTTNRTVQVGGGDSLAGKFAANTFQERIETGSRKATPYGGITPYGAVQATTLALPAYYETSALGPANGFGLNYASKTITDTRTELGAKYDTLIGVGGSEVLFTAKTAFVHDFVPTASAQATLQALPGASFTVNGATPQRNAALVQTGLQIRLARNVTLEAWATGEFSGNSTSYGGRGIVRYAW